MEKIFATVKQTHSQPHVYRSGKGGIDGSNSFIMVRFDQLFGQVSIRKWKLLQRKKFLGFRVGGLDGTPPQVTMLSRQRLHGPLGFDITGPKGAQSNNYEPSETLTSFHYLLIKVITNAAYTDGGLYYV